ncbi:MAG: transcriptional regulator NrdR [Candidatus Omnitrophica bacterium CG07_land_8_20_14_0_80_42_15]|uniref:Transcriptional repressor NrdR n=1 Tax=Candidatus Aquitaenariimonas noxiae TaxID=1974741 RepID=A0A2J0L2C9_9BACT|nr:MAG: transcriptional regulator NrdR [Candidatus Omnitrophica bacterium CG07_land_8_20_14_0_80_42_15]
MKCPYCGKDKDKVIDSRVSGKGKSIRRRRECLKCKRRFTTYEHVEEIPLMVIKKDGRREPFDRNKIIAGVIKACEKRPISIDKLEDMADKIEQHLQKNFEKEVKTKDIGELVMKKLAELDEIAYVRFASVYRQFKDINQFMKELRQLLGREGF